MAKIYLSNVSCLNDDILFNKAYSLVDKNRQEKIDKLNFRKDKILSLGSYVVLLYSLKQEKYNKPLTFTYNENGKPYLKNIYFNISHSGDYVMCAISNEEIGCDIEKIKEIDMKIAKRFFCESEYQNIITTKDDDLFFKYWTLKESYMKNVALGLSLGLNNCEIVLDENIHLKDNSKFKFNNYTKGDYVYSVCHFDNEVTIKEINIEDLLNNC